MTNLTETEWNTHLSNNDDAVILDVRTEDECKTGMLENAICIDFLDQETFISEIKNLDTQKSYLVYCRIGNRSTNACLLMEQLGFEKTYNLIGGIMNWKG